LVLGNLPFPIHPSIVDALKIRRTILFTPVTGLRKIKAQIAVLRNTKILKQKRNYFFYWARSKIALSIDVVRAGFFNTKEGSWVGKVIYLKFNPKTSTLFTNTFKLLN
jgi:hypothetical protein